MLQLLLKQRLFVKLKKSIFNVDSIPFLGFVVSKGVLQMDQARTKALKNWPIPNLVCQVQQFLGFANFFRSFIWNFSSIAAHLLALTERKRFQWTDPAQVAFEKLI